MHFSLTDGGVILHYHDEATFNKTLCGVTETDYVDLEDEVVANFQGAAKVQVICMVCLKQKEVLERGKRYAI